MERSSSHGHAHAAASAAALRNALVLTLIILAIEAVVGMVANSLALLADAGHILTDAVTLGLAWFAVRLSERPASTRHTFGYRRGGILAAFFNSMLLVGIALAIGVEAFLRLRHPEPVLGAPVIAAACVAIFVNGWIAGSLHGTGAENLNIRAALLHVVGDLGASFGVLASGVLILTLHWALADPLISLAIALLIAFGAVAIVRESVSILMEGIPRDIDLHRVQETMREIPGVLDVHDLHVWALSDGYRLLSAHVTVPEQSLSQTATLLADVKLLLQRRFHIEHATIEVECIDCLVPPRRAIRFYERDEPPEAS